MSVSDDRLAELERYGVRARTECRGRISGHFLPPAEDAAFCRGWDAEQARQDRFFGRS